MRGIVIDIDPVALSLGPLSVRWFGLALAAALLAGLYLGLREGRRKGIAADDIYAVALWCLVTAIVCARIFHALDELDYYLRHPLETLALYEGGLSFWGGLIGGFLGGWLYLRRRGLPLGPMADLAVPSLLVGQAIGRAGSIINGDAYGRSTDLPWAFTYIHPDALIPILGVPTHPYPVYEMVWSLASLALLWRLRDRLPVDGLLFLLYAFLYGLGRFALGFTRQEAVVLLGLQQTQLLSLLVLIVAAIWAARLLRDQPSTVRVPENAS